MLRETMHEAISSIRSPSVCCGLTMQSLLREDNQCVGSVGEDYSTSEKQLNEYRRLHPMLTLEATNAEALKTLMERSSGRVDIALPELPVVSKSYEDMYLRPARTENGERSCIVGNKCLCKLVAQFRYSKDTDEGFIGTEFLLPAQRDQWQRGNGLPALHGKCLLCIRYFTNYCFLIAASDPDFLSAVQQGRLRLQTHCNVCKEIGLANHLLEPDQPDQPDLHGNSVVTLQDGTLYIDGQAIPSHVNGKSNVDGYLPSAMLNVDQAFVNTRPGRETTLSELAWKPFVRFNSRNYKYVRDPDTGERRILQVGIGYDTVMASNNEVSVAEVAETTMHLNDQPPCVKATRAAA